VTRRGLTFGSKRCASGALAVAGGGPPDGSRLLLGGHESGKSGLYVVDVASGAATSTRMGDSSGLFGSVSPDGRRIAVSRFKGAWEGQE